MGWVGDLMVMVAGAKAYPLPPGHAPLRCLGASEQQAICTPQATVLHPSAPWPGWWARRSRRRGRRR